MQNQHNIIIAGAGGIAKAAALLLSENSYVPPNIFMGNRTLETAEKGAEWIKSGITRHCEITAFHLPPDEITEEMKTILGNAEIMLDCLPGGQAPRMAQLAMDYNLHYINLTEYVAETNQIIALAKDAETGFVLQSGIAPGYIDILANGLFQRFCKEFSVEKADKLEFKVGALTNNAIPPHFYGFTWSPIGVATEYLMDAIVIRDFKKTTLSALSDTRKLIIDGVAYEDDLTSGGAADLPDALAGKVRSLDYKTIRYPGHYDWIRAQVSRLDKGEDQILGLQQKMEAVIPRYSDDKIILYAAVEGKDQLGRLQRKEVAKVIPPQKVGKRTLRAIQTTTAVPMLQAAKMLLEGDQKGVVLQSQIDPDTFLKGSFVVPVFGEVW